MKEFNVSIEDKVGSLRDVAKLLGDGGVNIRAISSELHDSKARLHIVVEKESIARQLLKDADYNFMEQDIVHMMLDDQPGELAKYADRLANAGVNVRAVYLLGKANNKTEMVLSIDDLETARRLCYVGEKAIY